MQASPERIILVVDDDEAVRDGLQRVLEQESYTVLQAESAKQALSLMTKNRVHILISDYEMPGTSGLELLKIVRARHPHVCRIMLTAHGDPHLLIRSINEGEVHRFIEKPWDNILLKVTLFFAFETLALEEENRRLIEQVQRQIAFIRELETRVPGISLLTRDEKGEISLAPTGSPSEIR